MNSLLIIGVGATVLLVIVVGMLVGRKVEGDSQNFLVAGRNMPIYLVAPALMVAAVDSNATVGNMDLGVASGFWAGALLAIGLGIALLLSGIFVAKPMNEMGLFSLGDFFRIKYGHRFEILAACVMILAYVILLAGNLVAIGLLFEYFLGIPYLAGLFIMAALVLLYTLCGGLLSDAYTAAIQMVITLVATVVIGVFVFTNWGFTAPEGMGIFDWGQLTDSSQGAAINWATIISLGVGDIVALDFQQRIYSAKSPKTARNACFVSAFLVMAVGIVYGLIASTCANTLGITGEETSVLYEFLDNYAPSLIAVIVLSGLVAASFSTASGAILSVSEMIVRNIGGFRRNVNVNRKDPQLLWVRLCMVPLALAGILIAARLSETGILLTLAFDLMLCCLIPALFGGLFWKRSSKAAVFASCSVGLVLRIAFFVLTPTIYGAENTLLYFENPWLTADIDGWNTFICFGASLITYFAVAAFCPRTAADEEAEKAELAELHEERTVESEILYIRAVTEQREDTLSFYKEAKEAGFPVEEQIAKAEADLHAPIVWAKNA